MAKEVTVSVSLRVNNGNADESFAVAGVQVDQTTQGSDGGIIQIGTASRPSRSAT